MAQDQLLDELRLLGEELTRQAVVEVWCGGIVRPSGAAAFSQPKGRGSGNGNERSRGSAAGSREGTAGGKGTTGGSGTTRPSAPDVFGGARATYERQLETLCEEYPGSQFWLQDRGLWLLVPSAILHGLDRRALFLVAVPYDFRAIVSAWGFWDRDHNPGYAQWIGPRHTNYPTGSICAFHPGGPGSWQNGGSLVTLIDLYSEWALRHLHLEHFGRWPGAQVALCRYERMIETHPDELCGCGSPDKTYAQCHEPGDRAKVRAAEAFRFYGMPHRGPRKPPVELLEFLRGHKLPPQVLNYAALPSARM